MAQSSLRQPVLLPLIIIATPQMFRRWPTRPRQNFRPPGATRVQPIRAGRILVRRIPVLQIPVPPTRAARTRAQRAITHVLRIHVVRVTILARLIHAVRIIRVPQPTLVPHLRAHRLRATPARQRTLVRQPTLAQPIIPVALGILVGHIDHSDGQYVWENYGHGSLKLPCRFALNAGLLQISCLTMG